MRGVGQVTKASLTRRVSRFDRLEILRVAPEHLLQPPTSPTRVKPDKRLVSSIKDGPEFADNLSE